MLLLVYVIIFCVFFFFNDTATTEIYTLSLHDALPISLMTQEDLKQIRVIVSAAISANNAVLFAAMRAIEEHVDLRFDEHDKRLELVERRLDRLDSRFSVFEFQMAGIGKSLTIGEKFDGELSNTQVAQQRAIDELARRVAKIEQRLNQ